MTSYRMFDITCPSCKKTRSIPYRQYWAMTKGITSNVCFACSRMKKGSVNSGSFRKGDPSWKKGVYESHIGKKIWWGSTGYHHTAEAKKKISEAHKGEKSWKWKKDRSNMDPDRRWVPEYIEWRTKVFTRDGFKCKMSTNECVNYIQAHHILRWSTHPELRYDVNNGITLCRVHHPLKVSEEKRLAPEFNKLVSASKDHYFE